GSASCTSLIQLSTPESVVSAELRKPGQGFAWGQQWSPSAGPAQGIDSGRDKYPAWFSRVDVELEHKILTRMRRHKKRH
ncbi:hypothetical protein MTR67_000487, partial [Solanum verrucosum]